MVITPHSPQAGDSAEVDAAEAQLRRRLADKLAECERLRNQVAELKVQRDATHQSGIAGIAAARTHMLQLTNELYEVRRVLSGATGDAEQDTAEDGTYQGSSVIDPTNVGPGLTDDEKEKQRVLNLQVRRLRHEVARWRHEVEVLEAGRPQQEDEIVQQKAELTHVLDVLESTRHAVRHLEVERDMRPRDISLIGGEPGAEIAPTSGMSIHAIAERNIRERCEMKNSRLSEAAKKLADIMAAQQLHIQRLEKQLLKEERELGQKDTQIIGHAHRTNELKGALRRHSDDVIATSLGFPTADGGRRAASMPPGKGPRWADVPSVK
eukprot:gnl/TRDRNA2_/TRDRNA2_35318_c0_seq1.p1 gnl/TRDRNA2_/TRDRNA2_35318_c0~~gnl/TRDRNA2_/TRDRNA2_35318_c0_seq1.p1  ORF type:complete len:323 (-),score=76.63 gnl/TRDRNA2_/TRDRNA2_35318_c0_seq1:88-1056(-)